MWFFRVECGIKIFYPLVHEGKRSLSVHGEGWGEVSSMQESFPHLTLKNQKCIILLLYYIRGGCIWKVLK
ncbi:MAG: hypothetical protein QG588_299 [Candidatus Poribacteria bacterium]|nr:hypothetical protein [Candidatus Poribacteria bacterium]